MSSQSTVADTADEDLPGAKLDPAMMPGHWLLARMGKRVLRPGGLELTRKMLAGLAIQPSDMVVELAPGLGVTTRMILATRPASYVGVERDPAAARMVSRLLPRENAEVRHAVAANTGLEDQSVTVVFGEAMLTMQTDHQKREIVREVHRILKPGGRYGIHELALYPDHISEAEKLEIHRELSGSIHVGARPLTVAEWRKMLADEGFELETVATAPMHLLELSRIVADEGVAGTLRIIWNVMRDTAARSRILRMRAVFRKHLPRICAVTLVVSRKEA